MSVEYQTESGFQFVDTNVLLYAHDNSADIKYDQAKQLMISLWRSGRGFLSVQVLQEFFVTITRKVKNPMPPERAKELIQDLSLWQIHQPTAVDVIEAIDLQARYQLSFWDAMIIRSAKQLNCSVLWREDMNACQRFGEVELKTPF